MGTSAEHVAKWRHNRDFIKGIPETYCDWQAVVAFYSAVHAVEALFVRDKVAHEGTHQGRNQILKTRARYTTIWKHFRPLFNAGWVARYHCDIGGKPGTWIAPADVRDKFVSEHLYEIEKLVAKLLTLSIKDFPPLFPAAPSTSGNGGAAAGATVGIVAPAPTAPPPPSN